MVIAKKKITRKASKKRTSTPAWIEKRIAAKDTLFPEKVAEAKEMLRNTKFPDGFFD
jgi:hypothetical protein